MEYPIYIPQISNHLTGCKLIEWRKEVGDTVLKGEPLLISETQKASINLESPETGTLIGIFVRSGEWAEVTAPVGILQIE